MIAPGFEKLQNKFKDVGFFYYHDNRDEVARQYHPSIRPHILKKHWRKNPWLENEVIFYMEADTLLVKPIQEAHYIKTQKWYLSDTESYIGHDYIVECDPRFLDLFSSIVRVDKEVIKANQKNSGGAQYIMKNLTEEYWRKVEMDCVEIWHKGQELQEQILLENPEARKIQIWTSCMWAHLWNAWYFGHQTTIAKSLDFTWATDPKEYLDKRRIFHNAGVTSEHKNLLHKAKYMHSHPFDEKLEIDQTKAGSWYWAKVQQTGMNSCLKS